MGTLAHAARSSGAAIATLLLCVGGVASESCAAAEAATLRLDYYHSGNATQELFSVHQVVVEPLPWPGNPGTPQDRTNRGKYLFEVIDPESSRVLYSRGFSSIYGEWETTGEAARANRTFHESLRFPNPGSPVTVRVYKRDEANAFQPVWETDIDPDDMLVVRARPPAPAPVLALEENGPWSDKVDLLILGDGYTEGELEKFEQDAARLMEALFEVSPFRERRRDFNVWAMAVPTPQSGVSRPSSGQHRWSPLGTRYDAFRSERYVLTFDNLAFRTVASFAPYDFVEILVNNETYGGGGIFGLYSTAAAGSEWAPYLFIHEFGHHFAALADEYYTSPVAYEPVEPDVEPWEPNATALHDPGQLKWKRWLTPDTPLPTPWPKAEFEEYARGYQARRARLRQENRPEAEMNALFHEFQRFADGLFAGQPHAEAVGAFEGANYEATGFYRPAMNCLMFTRHDRFCSVCRAAIEEIIDLHASR